VYNINNKDAFIISKTENSCPSRPEKPSCIGFSKIHQLKYEVPLKLF
jgi:hypothetical protein